MWCGGRKISHQKKLVKETSSRYTGKYWIHKFDQSLFKELDKEKTIGAEKKLSTGIKPVSADDKILIFSTLNINNEPIICFVAYTMVDETFESKIPLYNKYQSIKKLKLKGIKYFNDPVIVNDLVGELSFTKNPKKQYNYLRSEYREITETDFKHILLKTSRSKIYPAYFENISFNLEEFLLITIKSLFNTLKKIEKRDQIEIRSFINILQDYLIPYGIQKTNEELEEFYGRNVWKLGFRHTPSRDPDKFVLLYNQNGRKNQLSYISLN